MSALLRYLRANGPTWISLDVKRVIARSSKIPASNVIVRKDLTMKSPLQVFANQLEFATIAGDSENLTRDTNATLYSARHVSRCYLRIILASCLFDIKPQLKTLERIRVPRQCKKRCVQARVKWYGRTIAEKIASHSCFIILKHDKTRSSKEPRT